MDRWAGIARSSSFSRLSSLSLSPRSNAARTAAAAAERTLSVDMATERSGLFEGKNEAEDLKKQKKEVEKERAGRDFLSPLPLLLPLVARKKKKKTHLKVFSLSSSRGWGRPRALSSPKLLLELGLTIPHPTRLELNAKRITEESLEKSKNNASGIWTRRRRLLDDDRCCRSRFHAPSLSQASPSDARLRDWPCYAGSWIQRCSQRGNPHGVSLFPAAAAAAAGAERPCDGARRGALFAAPSRRRRERRGRSNGACIGKPCRELCF